jgi:NADH-quinone oxidoreductase subunit N
MVWLAVVGVLLSLVGAFYYLRIVKTVYFDEPTDTEPVQAGGGARAVLALNGLLVLALGVLPGPLMGVCVEAVKRSFLG